MSSLFGDSSAAPSNPFGGSSLFGNTNNQPSTSAQTTQPAGGGFLSGLGSQSQSISQPQSTGSDLFGFLKQNKQQTTQSQPTGGIFGSTQASQAPAQASQPQAGASLFGNSIVNNNPTAGQFLQNGASQVAQQGQSSMGESRTNAHFESLIERGRKRKGGVNGVAQFGELPSLQLSLGDIAGKVRHLGGSTVGPAARGRDARARDLLAASGVPRGATLRDLNSIGTFTGAAPITSSTAGEVDLEAYVANLRAKTTQDLINENLEQTKRDFNVFLEENIQMNWQEQRQRIHEHFGIARPTESMRDSIDNTPNRGAFGRSSKAGFGDAFRASGMSRSVLGGSVSRSTMRQSLFSDVAENSGHAAMVSAVDDPHLRGKQDKYASKVRELNASRKQGVVYPIIQQFAQVEFEAGGDSTQHLTDAYRALKEIVRENQDVRDPSEVGAIKERQYAKDYLEEGSTPAKATAIKRQIMDGSRKFLEDQYYHQVEAMVARHPQEANMGGIPSKVSKVRAYLRIKAGRRDLGGENAELTMVGDDYCWALIYHLLRCGLVNEAKQYVSQNERAIKSMDRNFPMYMTAYNRDPERRLPRDMQTRINSEYSQRTRLAPDNSIDPYRMACYKLVGRCDLSHKTIDGITLSMEDWLWLLFSLARETNRVEEAAGEYFGLDDVKVIVEQIGQRHFATGGENATAYATFFLMQIMTGLFEKAIAYLYPHNYLAAVHFAIALDFYGLLRVSTFDASDSELLTYTTRSQPQIGFDRLLGYYTQDFRLSRPEAAADYVVLICLNADLPGAAGESQRAVCQQALKELVLETREFALLLGDIQMNGQRLKGAIEERLPLIQIADEKTFLRTLTIQAASIADDAGRTNDAVLLHHLAEEYDTVVTVLARTLSDAICSDLAADPFNTLSQTTEQQQEQQALQQQSQSNKNANSTLSLTTSSNPLTLARAMLHLYDRNALIMSQIRELHRDTLSKLLQIAEIRICMTRHDYTATVDALSHVSMLPLRTAGNVTLIRGMAQNFNVLPPVLTRCIGNLLVWTIGAIGEERKRILQNAYAPNLTQAELMVVAAKDVMVFAGLIRYKLSSDVFEMLARAGQSIGA